MMAPRENCILTKSSAQSAILLDVPENFIQAISSPPLMFLPVKICHLISWREILQDAWPLVFYLFIVV